MSEERKTIYLCLAHMSEDGMEQKYVIEAFEEDLRKFVTGNVESAVCQDWSLEETRSSSSPPMNVTCSTSTLSELMKSGLSRRERMERLILHPWQNSSLVKMSARVIF